MSTEREEMAADEERKAMARAEALSEAMRILPMARSWGVFAVMPDGNPAAFISSPQYADSTCIAYVSADCIRRHLGGFHSVPSQQI